MRTSAPSFVLFILLLSLLLAGCNAHFPLNSPLETWDPELGYRFPGAPEPPESEDLLVVLTFSGGGTRAAALAWGVLETLREVEITRHGRRYRLIEEIDLISAVSGGSIVGAYFALHGERAFDDFPERFLENDIQGKALDAALSPRQWRRLASRHFDRIDLLAEIFDRELFEGHTFADLQTRRPFLFINATDVTQGTAFSFTQRRFDRICSDLSDFPISRATAASAAVPVLLRPLTLASYGWECGYQEDTWVEPALAQSESLERRRQAEVVVHDSVRSWVHLIDGGVADNIGLQTLYDSLLYAEGQACGFPSRRPSDVIVISVDAGTGLPQDADFQENGPSLVDVVWVTANTSVDRLSERSLDQMGTRLVDWACSRASCDPPWPTCAAEPDPREPIPGLRIYPIVVSLQNLRDPVERATLKSVPTTFSLDSKTVERLRRAGRDLLEASSVFRRLIEDDVP